MSTAPWEILNQNRLNVPGLLQAAEQSKQRRLEEMLLNRKVEREDRETERQDKLLGIMAKVRQPGSQPKGGDPASPGPAAAVSSPGTPQGAPQAAPVAQPNPAAQSWVEANRDVVDELMTIAPDQAFAMTEKLSKLDEAGLARVKEMNELRGRVALHLQSIPAAQRGQEMQRLMPQLAQMGVTPEVVQQELGDLSDAALQAPVALSMDIDKIMTARDRERKFAADQDYRQQQLGISREGLAVRQGALGLARQREGRVAAGGGESGDNSDLNYLMDD